jgi:hypothetical protein
VLRWHLQYAGKISYWQKRGLPCPDPIPPRPELPEHLQFYWKAYWAVYADRSMETGRISFIAMDRYAERYGLDDVDSFDRLTTILAAMDSEYHARTNNEAIDDVEGIKALLQSAAAQRPMNGDGAE